MGMLVPFCCLLGFPGEGERFGEQVQSRLVAQSSGECEEAAVWRLADVLRNMSIDCKGELGDAY